MLNERGFRLVEKHTVRAAAIARVCGLHRDDHDFRSGYVRENFDFPPRWQALFSLVFAWPFPLGGIGVG